MRSPDRERHEQTQTYLRAVRSYDLVVGVDLLAAFTDDGTSRPVRTPKACGRVVFDATDDEIARATPTAFRLGTLAARDMLLEFYLRPMQDTLRVDKRMAFYRRILSEF